MSTFRFDKLLIVVATGLILSSAIGAQAAPRQLSHATIVVAMKGFAFSPTSVSVRVGDTVKWTYDETATDVPPGCETPIFQVSGGPRCPGHSTTSDAKGRGGHPLWDSGVHRAKGFPFSYRFTRPGTFTYFCVVHGGTKSNNPLTHMNGTVTVER